MLTVRLSRDEAMVLFSMALDEPEWFSSLLKCAHKRDVECALKIVEEIGVSVPDLEEVARKKLFELPFIVYYTWAKRMFERWNGETVRVQDKDIFVATYFLGLKELSFELVGTFVVRGEKYLSGEDLVFLSKGEGLRVLFNDGYLFVVI